VVTSEQPYCLEQLVAESCVHGVGVPEHVNISLAHEQPAPEQDAPPVMVAQVEGVPVQVADVDQ
jgi:hypothetical protein